MSSQTATQESEPSSVQSECVEQSTKSDCQAVKERVISESRTTLAFQAETAKLLDIVANSLYSEREVFCRELVSNAADALEKCRQERLLATDANGGAATGDADQTPLAIQIQLDTKFNTFTIQDNGIGMTKEDMIRLLGTIARSGSQAYREQMSKSSSTAADTAKNIIGQFGVGFYSSFMVGRRVQVFSRTAQSTVGHCWTSEGFGTFDIAEAESVAAGTKIVIEMKEDARDFLQEATVQSIIQKYSNFVGFPITVNGKPVNTVQPLWTLDKSSVTDDQHKEFYKFIAHAWDSYRYRLHFQVDAPMHIASLLYIPERHTEFLGMGRMEPGVNLYSRRVLIQSKSKHLLPEYLRFVKGVVDSEDLPVNLSRELVQNNQRSAAGNVLKKVSEIITMKVIRWLQDEARRDPKEYSQGFFKNFGSFIKEGVCTVDSSSKEQSELAKLLRYESSLMPAGETTSLADYLQRKHSDQKAIYYLISPNRQWAEESPYFESMKKKGWEVLFMVGDATDEFVAERLQEFQGVALKSLDADSDDADHKPADHESSLGKEAAERVVNFMKDTLKSRVKEIKMSNRLHSYPAMVTGHESPTMRKLLKMVPQSSSLQMDDAPKSLEINGSHPIIQGIDRCLSAGKEELARECVQQIYDNALIAAGAIDDPRVMLKRLNKLVETSLGYATGSQS